MELRGQTKSGKVSVRILQHSSSCIQAVDKDLQVEMSCHLSYDITKNCVTAHQHIMVIICNYQIIFCLYMILTVVNTKLITCPKSVKYSIKHNTTSLYMYYKCTQSLQREMIFDQDFGYPS